MISFLHDKLQTCIVFSEKIGIKRQFEFVLRILVLVIFAVLVLYYWFEVYFIDAIRRRQVE